MDKKSAKRKRNIQSTEEEVPNEVFVSEDVVSAAPALLQPSTSRAALHAAGTSLTDTRVDSLQHSDHYEPLQVIKCEVDEEPECLTILIDENKDSERSDSSLLNAIAYRIKREPTVKKTKLLKFRSEFKAFALGLYLRSPTAYKALKKSFGLPSISTLYRFCISLSSDLNEQVLKALELKVDAMNDKEKQSVLCVGSIDVTPSLHYDAKKDYVSGLHEVDGVQTLQPATKVLVVAVRGLFHKWKQPIAIVQLAKMEKYLNVKNLIDKILDRMFLYGLRVRVLISDLQTDLVTEANLRGCNAKSPYFYHNDTKIYYIYDPKYLLKDLRDTLVGHDLTQLGGSLLAKWSHIEDCYKHDVDKKYRLAPKLTLEHVAPNKHDKDGIRITAETLSIAVATAIATYVDTKALPMAAMVTAHWLMMVNKMMSMIDVSATNSTDSNAEVLHRPFSGDTTQVDFLVGILTIFQTLRVIDAETRSDRTDSATVLQGFRMTINGIFLLYGDLNTEKQWAPLVGLSRDCLNDYFNKIRDKYGNLATSNQVLTAVATFPIFSIFQYFSQKRCSNDLETFLWHARQMPDIDKYEDEHAETYADLRQFRDLQLPSENKTEHLALYLLYRAYMHHSHCYVMKLYSCSGDVTEDDDDNQPTGGYTTGDGDVINMVPREFTEFVDILELKFKEYFNESRPTRSISGLLSYVNDVTFEVPCVCFPVQYVKQMFMCYRFCSVLERNNQLFKSSKDINPSFIVTDL
ncbi:uncharacterized protein LOC142979175 [Anticarsia gemmatalis]|uniref:uncharacterized protein LOC142979175 n=1 Tax=Anticarsia gemmatalis TaxID=129554 RepID=UPI003F7572F9